MPKSGVSVEHNDQSRGQLWTLSLKLKCELRKWIFVHQFIQLRRGNLVLSESLLLGELPNQHSAEAFKSTEQGVQPACSLQNLEMTN